MAERRNLPWVESDYERLVAAIRAGRSDEEIAADLGRSVRAIEARAALLAGPSPASQKRPSAKSRKSGSAMARLRKGLANPAYDWRKRARDAHTREGIPYWDNAADNRLIQAWMEGGIGMGPLAAALGVEEVHVAQRLVDLGLAGSRHQVVDRLGATGGGALALQAALERDISSAALHLLIVTDGDRIVHVSLHPDKSTALATRETRGLLRRSGRRWAIFRGVVGQGAATHITGDATPTALETDHPAAAPAERESDQRK
ncbi:hypothetical protein [Nocardia farcinica]|uniref:hypothetical protein n=1 Tax=Nocardia farcinica TaxID=37329 RepID=UPI0024542348|nr:hypothetical protein [Nocardia farcinica]